MTAPVSNIIAVRDGARREAIALVSHYDSVPEASGAIDNGIGVATSLEAARVLAASPMTASLFVLITDGEEIGLMGARALVQDAEVAGRLRAFLNFDNTGASGPSLLYETAAASAVVHAWAAAAPAPAGASFATEIYKRLPNDTDFTILKTTGAAGLNFAVVGDAYAYHTDRDVAARVPTSTLQRGGDNTVRHRPRSRCTNDGRRRRRAGRWRDLLRCGWRTRRCLLGADGDDPHVARVPRGSRRLAATHARPLAGVGFLGRGPDDGVVGRRWCRGLGRIAWRGVDDAPAQG